MAPGRRRRADAGAGEGRAWQAALKLLGRRDHLEAELRDRLLRAGHDADEVGAAVRRCAELGLVDDERVAARFVELRSVGRGWGPARLALELRRRGAPEAVVDRVVRLDEDRAGAALELALRRAESRQPERWWRVGAARARLVSSLIRRGFEPDDARAAVEDLAAVRERDDHALDDGSRDPPALP